jgi:uncharacterized protein YcaQ
VIELTRRAARRFLVQRHLLAPPRALPPTHDAIMQVVERLGSLQFDPLDVPGARNHELVLHARIANLRHSLCDELLYRDRRLYEAYNKSLNFLPTAELPYYRHHWERFNLHRTRKLLTEHGHVADAIVERLREEGPLPPSAFDGSRKVEGYWGVTTSLSRHVLEALFITGRVGIARREGNKRVYDVTERLHPRELLERRTTAEEAQLHILLSRHRGVGLLGDVAASEITNGTGSAADRKRRTRALVDRGVLLPAHVEGVKGTRYVLASEKPLLDAPFPKKKHVTFLAPLDPFVWDRRLLAALFDFEYIWEVYTPLAKRKHGYYVLPLLFGDALVGRIEPRFDKKTATLTLENAWLEPGFDPDTPGFDRAFAEAFTAYATFVSARRIRSGRGRLARRLRGTLPAGTLAG